MGGTGEVPNSWPFRALSQLLWAFGNHIHGWKNFPLTPCFYNFQIKEKSIKKKNHLGTISRLVITMWSCNSFSKDVIPKFCQLIWLVSTLCTYNTKPPDTKATQMDVCGLCRHVPTGLKLHSASKPVIVLKIRSEKCILKFKTPWY